MDIEAYRVVRAVRTNKGRLGLTGSWENCIPKMKVLNQEIIKL